MTLKYPNPLIFSLLQPLVHLLSLLLSFYPYSLDCSNYSPPHNTHTHLFHTPLRKTKLVQWSTGKPKPQPTAVLQACHWEVSIHPCELEIRIIYTRPETPELTLARIWCSKAIASYKGNRRPFKIMSQRKGKIWVGWRQGLEIEESSISAFSDGVSM